MVEFGRTRLSIGPPLYLRSWEPSVILRQKAFSRKTVVTPLLLAVIQRIQLGIYSFAKQGYASATNLGPLWGLDRKFCTVTAALRSIACDPEAGLPSLIRPSQKGEKRMKRFHLLRSALFCLMVLCVLAVVLNAADKATVTPGDADREIAKQAKSVYHALPARNENGDALRSTDIHRKLASKSSSGEHDDHGSGTRYEGDLQYHGGAVLQSVVSHNIYVNSSALCPPNTCWGNPEQFLKDYGKSDFVHIVDQYTGLNSDDRYTLGTSVAVNYPTSAHPYTDADMLAIVHAVALASGESGYGNIYHVFLTPGTDECFDATYSVCYSPDNGPTFYFCAYHGSADFNDSVGHVVYSVEPFQNVGGCSVKPGTPNGQLADSTNNVLSHEETEAITDPDGSAWWNSECNGLYGQEIGDECSFITFAGNNVYFDPSAVRLGEHKYAIQPEYSNRKHGCATAP